MRQNFVSGRLARGVQGVGSSERDPLNCRRHQSFAFVRDSESTRRREPGHGARRFLTVKRGIGLRLSFVESTSMTILKSIVTLTSVGAVFIAGCGSSALPLDKLTDAKSKAIKTVLPALQAFYATLSVDQKAILNSKEGRSRFWRWHDPV